MTQSESVRCSAVPDSAIPWTVVCQAPLSMGFSRQEYYNGQLFPSPGDLPDPEIKSGSPALQADSYQQILSHQGSKAVEEKTCYGPPGNGKLSQKQQSVVCHGLVTNSCPTHCNPMDCSLPGSSVHGILSKNTGVGCHFLLQVIFLTQGSNPGLLQSERTANPACEQKSNTQQYWHPGIHNRFLCFETCFPGDLDGKECACNAGDQGSIPGLRRSPGERNGYLLQYSCLQNPMDRGAGHTTVHGITELDLTEPTNTFTFFLFL